MKIKILSAFLLTFALFNAVSAQTPDKAKLDRFFDRLAEKNKAMGSLTIAKDGSLLYTRAIGYSQINGSERKPATTATRYRVGSITKMFTAAMIFQFVEEGKLKLSDTLDKFFPQIPNAGKITIAHILAHRSGIHDFIRDPDFRSWSMNPRTKDETLAFIAKGTPDFEPGEKRSYSNAGYVLLGFIVEKLAGKPYQDALKKRITGKLGLMDTYRATGKTDVSKKESFSYRYAEDWKQQDEIDLSIPGGAGAIVSTPSDLVKFIQALFDGKLISQENVNQTMKNGMGMSSLQIGDITFYGHGGSMDGFRSGLVYLPEEKLALAYTLNGTNYPEKNIVNGVFDIYWNKPFEIPTFESIAVSPEILEKYVGVYSSPGSPLKVTITRDATTLHAQTTGQSAFPLEATAADKFKFDTAGIVLEFDAAKNQMILKQGGRETVFNREK
ncbi:MAG TPA: serine hydrolase domain-containing protein [Pyrinomonadaceae bacterium]|nr:serine hydrolase domain-containing protein [Pyrinomonadaceae bacterium]